MLLAIEANDIFCIPNDDSWFLFCFSLFKETVIYSKRKLDLNLTQIEMTHSPILSTNVVSSFKSLKYQISRYDEGIRVQITCLPPIMHSQNTYLLPQLSECKGTFVRCMHFGQPLNKVRLANVRSQYRISKRKINKKMNKWFFCNLNWSFLYLSVKFKLK